jgi:hypothetical protein
MVNQSFLAISCKCYIKGSVIFAEAKILDKMRCALLGDTMIVFESLNTFFHSKKID